MIGIVRRPAGGLNFKSTLWEGVTKKSTLCTLVKMMTIMDDPLKINNFKVLFLGGSGHTKKRILCMLLIMFKILDDTLDHYLVEQTTTKQRRAAFSVAMEVQGH